MNRKSHSEFPNGILQGVLSQTNHFLYFLFPFSKHFVSFHVFWRLIEAPMSNPSELNREGGWVILLLRGLGYLFTMLYGKHSFDEPFSQKSIFQFK